MRKKNFVEIYYFIFLFLIVFAKNFLISIIFSSYEFIKMEFLLNDTQLGSLTSVFYLFDLLFAFFWIFIFSKSNNIHVTFLIGSIIWITPLFFFNSIKTYYGLITLISIIGIGIESTTLYFFQNITRIANSKNMGKTYALFIILQGLGSVIGVFFSGYLGIFNTLSWKIIFQMIGLIFTLIYLPISILLIIGKINPNQDLEMNQIQNQNLRLNQNVEEKDLEISKYHPYKFEAKSIKSLISTPINKILLIIGMAIAFSLSLLSIWQITYYQRIHNMNQLQSSITYIFNSGAEFFGTLFGGILIDKTMNPNNYIKIKIWLISFLSASLLFFIGFSLEWKFPNFIYYDFIKMCWMMFITAINNITYFFGFLIIFLGFMVSSISNSSAWVIVSDYNQKKDRSTMFALINIEISFGLFIGPYIGGYISDIINLKLSMLFAPIIYLIASILIVYLMKITQNLPNPDKEVFENE